MLEPRFRKYSPKTITSSLALCCILFASHQASANKYVTFQIVHTNDLHAALDTAGAPETDNKELNPELGGWAQVKTVMDRLTKDAAARHIPTIRLDAGDFTEGTAYYFPDTGLNVMKAFQAMGYDAAALGNHDWLMGADKLNEVYGKALFNKIDPETGLKNPPILSANVKIAPHLTHLKEQIIPSTQIKLGCTEKATKLADGCVKVGIFGLSTPEALYKWITRIDSHGNPMKIRNYIPAARRMIRELHKNNDYVIALTHIGVDEDENLAKKITGLDLIVGGHSHSVLDLIREPVNPKGEIVPVVQVGFNGMKVGQILVDIKIPEPGEKAERPCVTWTQYNVPHDTVPDQKVSQLLIARVKHARDRLNEVFGKDNLARSVGTSEVRLVSGSSGPTAFARFAAESMLHAVNPHNPYDKAQITVDVGEFHGNTPQPKGKVTREMLMNMYPRQLGTFYNGAEDPELLASMSKGIINSAEASVLPPNNPDDGWDVYHSGVPGWVIKIGLKYAVRYGRAVSTAGLNYTPFKMNTEDYNARIARLKAKGQDIDTTQYKAREIKINGNYVCDTCEYTVASPEGLIKGAYGITELTRLIIHHGRSAGVSLWDAMERYLSQIGEICIPGSTEGHFHMGEFSIGNKKIFSPELQKRILAPGATQAKKDLQGMDNDSQDWMKKDRDWIKIYEQFLAEVKERQESGDFQSDVDEGIEAPSKI